MSPVFKQGVQPEEFSHKRKSDPRSENLVLMLYLVLTVGIDTLLFENPVGLIEIEECSR
jgi:hypothetical protein